MRAVHLELTISQSAGEFQQKLNSFSTRKTGPELIIFNNGKAFRAIANWIRTLRESEGLQDFLGRREIRWKFNLSKAPWWGRCNRG